ncbi:hypothetical protein BKA56DRAFT_600820 [Ilyonectria sp. MPI-CAGE-AT-0026]|nr:hypothetical protein BKA56DRAFT_600820 [Ilyonectria sp. MPI-CAGE-AT-0026]
MCPLLFPPLCLLPFLYHSSAWVNTLWQGRLQRTSQPKYYLCSAIIDPGTTLTPIPGIERLSGINSVEKRLQSYRHIRRGVGHATKVWKAPGTSVPVCSMGSIQGLPT